MVLASDAGARILSYSGTKAWNSGSGHEPPPIIPVLLTVYSEIQSKYEDHLVRGGKPAPTGLTAAVSRFMNQPTLLQLAVVAEAIDSVCPVLIYDISNEAEEQAEE